MRHLNPVPIHEPADRWVGRYERGRTAALTTLEQTVEEAVAPKPQVGYVIYIGTTPEEIHPPPSR